MEPDRRSLQTLFAFAYGMQVGRMRRIAAELQKLAQQAQLATMASGAAIAIAAQNQIECIARSGGAAPQLGSKPEATVGLSGECIRTGIPQFCADTETHPFVDRMHSRTFGVRSIVYVPLFRGVQPAGVIGVFSDKPGHFTQHDLRVLQLIGREVTKALKWEPNPNATFAPVSTTVIPAEAQGPTAAAMPTLEVSRASEVTFSASGPELLIEVLPQMEEQHAELLATAAEIVATGTVEKAGETEKISTGDDLVEDSVEPSLEAADAELAPEARVIEAEPEPAHAESLFPEANRREWADPEDMEYPASVPSFFFLQERNVPRWAIIGGAVALLALFVWAGVRAAPRWFSKPEPSQMVYGPPQVTTDTNTSTADGAQPEPGLTAPLATVPGVPTVSRPEQSIANAQGTATYVKTVKTQITGTHTFISIYLSGPAQFQAHELTNPDRIYLDLHGVEVSPDLKDVKIAGVGPVADFRFSKSEQDVARLVMVLDAPCTYLVSVTSDPYVIVLDVQPLRMPRPGAAKRNTPTTPGA